MREKETVEAVADDSKKKMWSARVSIETQNNLKSLIADCGFQNVDACIAKLIELYKEQQVILEDPERGKTLERVKEFMEKISKTINDEYDSRAEAIEKVKKEYEQKLTVMQSMQDTLAADNQRLKEENKKLADELASAKESLEAANAEKDKAVADKDKAMEMAAFIEELRKGLIIAQPKNKAKAL